MTSIPDAARPRQLDGQARRMAAAVNESFEYWSGEAGASMVTNAPTGFGGWKTDGGAGFLMLGDRNEAVLTTARM